MVVIKNNEELNGYIKDYKIVFDCSIKCDFNINVKASIKAWDIKAWDIEAWDIKAWDIKALDIKARDIEARDIEALDIKARDIKALDIKARDIEAQDIEAWDIKARDIYFWSFCIVRTFLKCKSILGRRENNIYKCLDNDIEYIK